MGLEQIAIESGATGYGVGQRLSISRKIRCPLHSISNCCDRRRHAGRAGIELTQLSRREDGSGDEQNALAALVHARDIRAHEARVIRVYLGLFSTINVARKST